MNFTQENRVAPILKDIQRTFLFTLSFPHLRNMLSNLDGITLTKDMEEELLVRVRSVAIPSRGIEVITSNFGGLAQHFPGRPTFTYTFETVIEESENGNAHKILYGWQNAIFNIKRGFSDKFGKRPTNAVTSYTSDAILTLLSYNGSPSDKIILFKNCFIENVGDVSLSYDGNESVKFPATFRFDLWYLVKDAGESLIEL